MDRPPADPTKLLAALGEWESGEVLPGRTVSTLKTGGLRPLLEHVAASSEEEPAPDGVDAGGLLGTWMDWEAGSLTPSDALTALHEAGLRLLLTSLTAPAG